MLAPLSWLKDYVDIDVTPKELEEKLFSCGFEVEELIEVGKDVSGVVVGLVETCEPIPDTHLSLCQVNAGEHGTFQICCGADNVHAGGKFPLALVGATVYATAKDHVTIEGVMTIKKGKLRGYESFGMLCSGTELGLNEDLYPGAGYNGLLVLPEDARVGADVKPILGMDDWIFDIAITANRPDCQSIYGIAREVAAVLGKECKEPALDFTETDVKKDFHVTVSAKDLCPRYIAHYVHDVEIKESPAWMRRRLALVGIGGISNIVDITNYVLKELGQPMHAFDYAYLEGDEINVRRADDGEKITTLDEKEFELNNSNLVICDGKKPVALAGIMGGLNSEIQDTTKEVMFEAAKFARDNIRKSSRALGQSSDSSAMYAKGVYEYTTVMAMKRALHLVEELGCGKVSSTHIEVSTGNSIEPKEMKVSVKRVNGVLGIEVPDADIVRILTALNFAPVINGDELTLQIPAYREDMDSYPDVAEEVIRMYGYEHVIPTFMPTAKVTLGGLNLKQKTELGCISCISSEIIRVSIFSLNKFLLCICQLVPCCFCCCALLICVLISSLHIDGIDECCNFVCCGLIIDLFTLCLSSCFCLWLCCLCLVLTSAACKKSCCHCKRKNKCKCFFLHFFLLFVIYFCFIEICTQRKIYYPILTETDNKKLRSDVLNGVKSQ